MAVYLLVIAISTRRKSYKAKHDMPIEPVASSIFHSAHSYLKVLQKFLLPSPTKTAIAFRALAPTLQITAPSLPINSPFPSRRWAAASQSGMIAKRPPPLNGRCRNPSWSLGVTQQLTITRNMLRSHLRGRLRPRHGRYTLPGPSTHPRWVQREPRTRKIG